MHDWTFLSLSFDWKSGQAKLDFRNRDSNLGSLIAIDVTNLCVPRIQDWGPSQSVNTMTGPIPCGNGVSKVQIEMQSGDCIEIDAKNFNLPVSEKST
ncbi:hypothetical protein [Paraherbaspirillum soli]|uniref:Uncharacterized protein n=1 Tax=Paraherbaspirillum soli TaxID=631222 RepID=A0ABW0M3U9_9BURK